MSDPRGVNLLPASGEWVYDPVPHRAAHAGESAPTLVNLHAAPGGTRTDYSLAVDQLQARYPGCTTVSLVVAWFGNATDVTACAVYPATNYPGGTGEALVNGAWQADPWRCSGLTGASPGLIPLSTSDGAAIYGGTPSDPAVVRCIRDLRARGLRVVFYPFLLMDCAGYPWRGRITIAGADISAAATAAVAGFFGSAMPNQFSRDTAGLTVGYAGPPNDWTWRRMILHYANLCVVAGGVDLFLLGSEMRGLEALRGPAWSRAGTVATAGTASWDYPFAAAMTRLADDVRATFDAAGLARDRTALKNLVAYSADWSSWMGVQHADAAGQWPHLDPLYAHPSVDLVSFDNYLPLSDWTSGDGGLDAANWSAPAPQAWPPPPDAMNGLGLSGPPDLWSKAYLKANIEGGEKYAWFYFDSSNGGRGPNPDGSDLPVSRPAGDRLAQNRSPYAPGQELLANKQLRWWWHNPHRAIYDAGDGQGFAPHGPPTAWVPRGKSITFAEFGFPSCDRATNQPNVFFDPKSSESFTPYWSAWEPAAGAAFRPRRDDLIARLALDAVVEYWTSDGPQRGRRRRRADGGADLHVGVELGRPAVPRLPRARGLGRRAELADRHLARRQGRDARPSGGGLGAGGRDAADLPDPAGAGMVGALPSAVPDRRGGPRDGAREPGRTGRRAAVVAGFHLRRARRRRCGDAVRFLRGGARRGDGLPGPSAA